MKRYCHNYIRVTIFHALVLLFIGFSSCKKHLEIDLTNGSMSAENIFSTDATAIAAINFVLKDIALEGSFTGQRGFTTMTSLSSDELAVYSGISASSLSFYYYKNDLKVELPAVGSESWSRIYKSIYNINAAIQGLSSVSSELLTPAVRKQLLGEAKFLRAWQYFYLVNFFGDVPLVLTTDHQNNSVVSRTPVNLVYQQIIADLREAEPLLSSNYLGVTLLSGTTERTRPTKWAATALLARAYLYTKDYLNAEAESNKLLTQSGGLFSLVGLNGVFSKNSFEAIWQVQPTDQYFNTQDGKIFNLTTSGPNNDNPFYLSSQQLASFEAGDQRRVLGNWVNSVTIGATTYYYPFKYKKGAQDLSITSYGQMSEYVMVLRLAEQYLINAEAKANLNNISGAQNSLNVIRNRSGLPNTSASDKTSLLTAILHERQTELFTEMGHRWFDLKRTGKINEVMNVVTPLKGGTWEPTDQLYPIPLNDILKNPNLTQNPGY